MLDQFDGFLIVSLILMLILARPPLEIIIIIQILDNLIIIRRGVVVRCISVSPFSSILQAQYLWEPFQGILPWSLQNILGWDLPRRGWVEMRPGGLVCSQLYCGVWGVILTEQTLPTPPSRPLQANNLQLLQPSVSLLSSQSVVHID